MDTLTGLAAVGLGLALAAGRRRSADPARYGPPPKAARRIARLSGCRVTKSHRLHDRTWAHRVACASHAAKVQLLANLAEYDARTPDVRRAAELAATGAKTPGEQIAALHARVRDGVIFTRENVETFSPTMRTLDLGMGDCDDSARALLALLRSLGFEAGLQTLPAMGSGITPRHVAAQVRHGGSWRWLETTLAARPGEHPLAAARRLGVAARTDIAP